MGRVDLAMALSQVLLMQHFNPGQGIHRLVLSRSRDVSMHGEGCQEHFELRFGRKEVVMRAPAMEPDEADDSFQIGSFGVNRVMVTTEHPLDFIEEFGVLTPCPVRPIRSPS
ncbi:MAG TPA: hypothetical protein VNP04_20165 [Alphaproteobacteria bacterium]|nr:hypothetical protein [Alphaproteobacteria bacterium]